MVSRVKPRCDARISQLVDLVCAPLVGSGLTGLWRHAGAKTRAKLGTVAGSVGGVGSLNFLEICKDCPAPGRQQGPSVALILRRFLTATSAIVSCKKGRTKETRQRALYTQGKYEVPPHFPKFTVPQFTQRLCFMENCLASPENATRSRRLNGYSITHDQIPHGSADRATPSLPCPRGAEGARDRVNAIYNIIHPPSS